MIRAPMSVLLLAWGALWVQGVRPQGDPPPVPQLAGSAGAARIFSEAAEVLADCRARAECDFRPLRSFIAQGHARPSQQVRETLRALAPVLRRCHKAPTTTGRIEPATATDGGHAGPLDGGVSVVDADLIELEILLVASAKSSLLEGRVVDFAAELRTLLALARIGCQRSAQADVAAPRTCGRIEELLDLFVASGGAASPEAGLVSAAISVANQADPLDASQAILADLEIQEKLLRSAIDSKGTKCRLLPVTTPDGAAWSESQMRDGLRAYSRLTKALAAALREESGAPAHDADDPMRAADQAAADQRPVDLWPELRHELDVSKSLAEATTRLRRSLARSEAAILLGSGASPCWELHGSMLEWLAATRPQRDGRGPGTAGPFTQVAAPPTEGWHRVLTGVMHADPEVTCAMFQLRGLSDARKLVRVPGYVAVMTRMGLSLVERPASDDDGDSRQRRQALADACVLAHVLATDTGEAGVIGAFTLCNAIDAAAASLPREDQASLRAMTATVRSSLKDASRSGSGEGASAEQGTGPSEQLVRLQAFLAIPVEEPRLAGTPPPRAPGMAELLAAGAHDGRWSLETEWESPAWLLSVRDAEELAKYEAEARSEDSEIRELSTLRLKNLVSALTDARGVGGGIQTEPPK